MAGPCTSYKKSVSKPPSEAVPSVILPLQTTPPRAAHLAALPPTAVALVCPHRSGPKAHSTPANAEAVAAAPSIATDSIVAIVAATTDAVAAPQTPRAAARARAAAPRGRLRASSRGAVSERISSRRRRLPRVKGRSRSRRDSC